MDLTNPVQGLFFAIVGGLMLYAAFRLIRWGLTKWSASTRRHSPTLNRRRLPWAIPLAVGAWVLSFDKLTAQATASGYVDQWWEAAIWALVIDYALFVGWLALRQLMSRGWALIIVGAAATIWFQADITTPESWVAPAFLLMALWVLESPEAEQPEDEDSPRAHILEDVVIQHQREAMRLQGELAEAVADRDEMFRLLEVERETARANARAADEANRQWQQLEDVVVQYQKEAQRLQEELAQAQAQSQKLAERVQQAQRPVFVDPAKVKTGREGGQNGSRAPQGNGQQSAPVEGVARDSGPSEAAEAEAPASTPQKEAMRQAFLKEPKRQWTPAGMAAEAGVARTTARRFLRDDAPALAKAARRQ